MRSSQAIQSLFKIILIFLILPTLQFIAFSSLSLCDNSDGYCDISMIHVKNNGTQEYRISVSHFILSSIKEFAFCFRKRSVARSDNNKCQLTNSTSDYLCYYAKYNNSTNTNQLSFVNQYKASATLVSFTTNATTTAFQNYTGQSLTFNLSFPILQQNLIYEIVVGTKQDLSKDSNAKSGHFHTFNDNRTNSIVGNILMQRYYKCFYYYYEFNYQYNIIFYGGVIRNGKQVMYLGVVTYVSDGINNSSSTSVSLNMWGCLSFSRSHVNRDMIGFSTGSNQLFDMFSIYYKPPLLDSTTRLKGVSNLIVTSSTYELGSTAPYYYVINGYRPYDTSDFNGDELLFQKMGLQYCYAVGYSNNSSSIYPYDSNQKHPQFWCWQPILTISGGHHTLKLFLILIVLIFYSL